MRIWKIIMITSLLCAVGISSFGCASKSDSAVSENQIATVQRGDLVIDIAAVGNLAFSRTDELVFEILGTVEEVLVEEGESVAEGQVLVKLDTSDWEVVELERALLQAEINVINTELALEKAKDSWLETVSAGEKVRRLEERLEWYSENDPEDVERINEIEEDLEEAWNQFLRVASGSTDAREVAAKEMEVELAKARLEDAQKALEEALDAGPEITAPFDGIITRVNVDGGDEVLTGTVAVVIADPTKFEVELTVSEMDIFQVKLGGKASVQVDAMSMIVLPAEVTYISPTATIQSGVVNYKVTVEIQSLESVTQERQQGQGEQQGQMPAMIPEDFQLREGLTVTVSIIVEERNDVLLVPNTAIIRQGQKTYVQVLKDGVTELRLITTGISNWQYTEVTDGLSEGEKVVITQATTTPTTPQEGGMHIPGMGGFGE